jgi:hypothetical protein
MSALLLNQIATFASRYQVPVEHAHVLPALFDNVAKGANMTPSSLVNQATWSNEPLALYLVEVAAQVAAESPNPNLAS